MHNFGHIAGLSADNITAIDQRVQDTGFECKLMCGLSNYDGIIGIREVDGGVIGALEWCIFVPGIVKDALYVFDMVPCI